MEQKKIPSKLAGWRVPAALPAKELLRELNRRAFAKRKEV